LRPGRLISIISSAGKPKKGSKNSSRPISALKGVMVGGLVTRGLLVLEISAGASIVF
jgi:hypothetical protein